MDDLVKFLRDRNTADHHAYVEVAHRFGSDALLDSHLPMLDLVDMSARNHQAMARRIHVAQVSRTRSKCWRSHTPSTSTTARSGARRPPKRQPLGAVRRITNEARVGQRRW
ncbi:hypothetical protein GCM10010398_69380 [Streptomyces fimbriatus]